jgi:ribose-phosphate pyrophosphokinase
MKKEKPLFLSFINNEIDLSNNTFFNKEVIKPIYFSDNEHKIVLPCSVNNMEVFLYKKFTPNSDKLYADVFELLNTIDALNRNNVSKIHLVIPYLPFSRQERKNNERSSITAKMLAKLLNDQNIQTLFTYDLHTSVIEAFYDFQVNNLSPLDLMPHSSISNNDTIFISPDFGALKKTKMLFSSFTQENTEYERFLYLDKTRTTHNEISQMTIMSNNTSIIEGKEVFIYDDIIDTGGTIFKAAELIRKYNPKSITFFATHGIFSKGVNQTCEKLSQYIDNIITTNTLNNKEFKEETKLQITNIDSHILNILELHKSQISLHEYRM